jgi:acyl-CoA thioesterase-1
MNPLALYFASGESLYAGGLLLLAAIGASFLQLNKWLRRLVSLSVWTALALMLMACPPYALWVYVAFAAMVVAWLVAAAGSKRTPARRATHGLTSIALAISTIALCAAEYRHRFLSPIPMSRPDHLTIIGDSITAGLGDERSRWPVLFEKESGIPFKDLSRAGDQVAEANLAANRLTEDDTLLLIEIGGNDLIAGVPTAEFERQLRTLLVACCRPGRTVVMFELPLLPHRIGYGIAQRRLAAEFGVPLIPKRLFADVLRAGTSDGLHLSPTGAQSMAALVKTCLITAAR